MPSSSRPTPDVAAALGQVPLLSGLGKGDRRQLAETTTRTRSFPDGQTIVAEGTSGVGFFIILSGTADVTISGTSVNTLGPGDYFGEMALLKDSPRTATVTATSDVECVTMTVWDFKGFLQKRPEVAITLVEALADRVMAPPDAPDGS